MGVRGIGIGAWVSLVPGVASAATLQVGPDKPYATLAAAIDAAAPGDTIEVDAGEYVDDVITITTGHLTIRGVGASRSHLRATAPVPNLKGILAIEVGTGPIVLDHLEFSGAFIDGNGDNAAGVRMQGQSLVVRDCSFHDNQNGILAGGTDNYEIRVENSEFAYNGNPGSGQEHNVYVSGDAALFVFQGNASHHTHSGHTLKSRARTTHVLYNRFGDEADGTSSYLIDLPNGNLAYVVGNVIQQGPAAENTGTMLRYNAEDGPGRDNRLFVVNNTFVNDHTSSTAFVRADNTDGAILVLRNNLLVGPGTLLDQDSGTGVVTDEGNLMLRTPEFADVDNHDYRLLETSGARDAAVVPGSDGSFDLTPTQHHGPNLGVSRRPVVGALDVGAYEWGEADPPTEGTSGGETDDDTGSEPTAGADDATTDPTAGPDDGVPGDAGDTSSTSSSAANDASSSGGCSNGRPNTWLVMLIGLLALRRRTSGHDPDCA